MNQYVEISFDCLPLRSVGRFDPPLDASPELVAFCAKLRKAADKHGLYNTYYLHHARCVFHLTNDEQQGTAAFAFDGTVLSDTDDRKTLDVDFSVQLDGEVCDWLTAAGVEFLSDSVRHAVRVEFDRYISAGNLQRTIERVERIRAESEAQGGFMGWGL